MDDPFDRGRWPLPQLASELDDLAARSQPPDGSVDPAGADWAIDQLLDGAAPRDLCTAALWVGFRRGRSEGRCATGTVTHSVLAAASCASLGQLAEGDPLGHLAAMAAVQHVAYTLGSYLGGVNDDREGPSMLGWFEPHDGGADPVQEFLDAAAAGECDLADHCWLAAVRADPHGAEQALIAAAAAGYHLNEHKLVYPAQIRQWAEADPSSGPVILRAAARYAGNHLQDPLRSESRRADAAALALEAEDRPTVRGGADRVSVVATGIARTPHKDLGPLLTASLSDGLAPEDLVRAVSLVTAARFASTSLDRVGLIAAVHAGTGVNAVRRCLERASSAELRYELAICSTEGPTLPSLAGIEELAVPRSDDGALDDLIDALDEGDPDAAADAATAVPLDDTAALRTAWRAVFATGATDQWLQLHGIKHVVAMHDDFEVSDHPARVWYLAAAARTAALASTVDQPVAREVDRRLRGA
jgi:hypothetical protein